MSETALQTTPTLAPVAAAPTLPGMVQVEQHPDWRLLSRMPLRVSASVALPGFKVRDLLALAAGQVLVSQSSSSDNVPLFLSSVHLGWCEFEVVEQRMAMRLTRLT